MIGKTHLVLYLFIFEMARCDLRFVLAVVVVYLILDREIE